MRESNFQTTLIQELEELFPGCIVLKNDANYLQGFPDLTVLYKKTWAVLECKKGIHERFQPNQEYYIERCNEMSFSAMICPQNKEAVLYDLQIAFRTRRAARLSRSK